MFARKGFQATSMADIIAESGLSAGGIYGLYKSKEDLIQVAIAELLELPVDASPHIAHRSGTKNLLKDVSPGKFGPSLH